MTKIVILLIYFIGITSFANEKNEIDLALNIDGWILKEGQNVEIANYNLIMPKFKYSCSHVKYRMKEADSLDLDLLKISRSLSALGVDERMKLKGTGVSIYKNIVANRQWRFFEPILEVELRLKETSNNFYMVNTPFAMEHISEDNPSDRAMVSKKNNQPVIKLELTYLDVCLGYNINIATTRCMNLLNKNCRSGHHYNVNIEGLDSVWMSKYHEIRIEGQKN